MDRPKRVLLFANRFAAPEEFSTGAVLFAKTRAFLMGISAVGNGSFLHLPICLVAKRVRSAGARGVNAAAMP